MPLDFNTDLLTDKSMVDMYRPWTPAPTFEAFAITPLTPPTPHELFRDAEILSAREISTPDGKAKDQLQQELTVKIGAYARQASQANALYAVERFRPGFKALIAITRDCYGPPAIRPAAFAPLMRLCAARLPAYDFLMVLLRDMTLTRAEVFSYLDIVAKLSADNVYARVSKHEKLCGLIHLLAKVLPENEVQDLLNRHDLTNEDLREFRAAEYYKNL